MPGGVDGVAVPGLLLDVLELPPGIVHLVDVVLPAQPEENKEVRWAFSANHCRIKIFGGYETERQKINEGELSTAVNELSEIGMSCLAHKVRNGARVGQLDKLSIVYRSENLTCPTSDKQAG